MSCGVRLCPFEMRKRSMRAYYRFKKIIAELEDPRYIVLSMRNWALHELRAGIRELFASFGRLRRSALWHDSAKGALAALEVTFNEKTLTWHPHLNILIEGKFIDQDVLAAAWRKAARDEGLILPFIEKADAGTAKELVKYITKLVEFVHIPEAVGAFIDATKRARFLRTYGCLYGLKIEDEEDSENGKDPLTACPDCGSKEVVRLRKCFSQDDVYFDGKGVLRFCEPVDPFAVSVCDG
ncbi:MAG TPA: protein rep [Terriglobia bacterium]|nr:protein rep [Terriglobia bacterium]